MIEPPARAGRTLTELGLDTVPFEHPLTYPGRPVPWPALLRGERLLRLEPGPEAGPATGLGPEGEPGPGPGALGGPLGRWLAGWLVEGGGRLDQVLADLDRRHPVLARLFAGEGMAIGPSWPEPSRRGYPPNPYGG